MIEFIQHYALEFVLAGVGTGIISFFNFSFKSFKKNLEDNVQDIYKDMSKEFEKHLNQRFDEYTAMDLAIKEDIAELSKQIVKMNNDIDLLTKNTIAIAYEKLNFFYQRSIERGYNLTDEVLRVEPIYEYYEALGGNGSVKELHDAAMRLPVKTKKEADDLK